MISLRQCIIVEGKYDKQRLSRLVDATIIETDGFRIFRDREKRLLIQSLAEKNGIIILTDSDSAGFLIRRHIKSLVPPDRITNVYIPAILGKERRKPLPSKEGLLGVEGMEDEVLLKAFEQAGIVCGERAPGPRIEKLDLYQDGLSGRPGSGAMRQRLLKRLGLPHYITANSLLALLNASMTLEEYRTLVTELREAPNSTNR